MRLSGLLLATVFAFSAGQVRAEVDWTAADAEALKHFQALIRIDSSDPPGNETKTTEYLLGVLKAAGIDVQTFAKDPKRPNVVARIKGNGKKRPLLIMGHQDVVSIDAAKWKEHGPFSADRDGGFIYGRGTIDDKDNLAAGLMTMLLLKQQKIPLDRDVILLAESGEEGQKQFGIAFMVQEHFKEIDAEYCFAEGGAAARTGGKVKFATIQTTEKIARPVDLVATGISGHGSVPLETNAVAHLAKAVATLSEWQSPIQLNETTYAYFQRMAELSPPEEGARYRAVLKPGTKEADEALTWLRKNQPSQASMLHISVTPVIFNAGYRVNVIPSEAKATVDVRLLPQSDPEEVLNTLRKVVNDPTIKLDWTPRLPSPAGGSRLGTEAFATMEAVFKKHYDNAPVVPVMLTGGTDMSYGRQKGMQCYGWGPALDSEDGPKGFGAHSDQERLLESELYRFVRMNWDVITTLARSK